MRIAFVTPEYVSEEMFDGGLANYVHRVALALKNRGHYPVVFVSTDRDETFVHRDIEVHRVNCSLAHETVKPPLKLLEGLYRSLCKMWNPDMYKKPLEYQSRKLNNALLHQHLQKKFQVVQYASYRSPALHRHSSIPSIVRASSYEVLWNVEYDKPRNSYYETSEVSAYKKADAVFSPSLLIASHLTEVLGCSVPVIETPFFLETENFDDTLLDTYDLRNKQFFLFFGTIGLLKGCLTIAKTLNHLFSRYPNLHFVFIGKTTKYHKKNFELLIREEVQTEYQNRLLFYEKMKHSQLYPIIQAAKGIILPSRIDNLPNTCLEAMGLGKIVVGTRGASFDQLINDGENGFLCEIDNHSNLLNAMERLLLLSETEAQKMSKMAKERIKQLHPDIIIPKLLDYYQEVIAQHGRLQVGK